MRTSFVRLLATASLATLALAACGSSTKSSTATSGTTVAPGTTAPEATTTTTGSASSSGAATVTVSMNSKIGKNILVDSKGMTLYTFDADTTAGKSVCNAGCDSTWPALKVTGTPTYGDKVDASLFSTFTRDDGSTQLAVDGHPLYHYAQDTKAGDANGNGFGGVWYVVGADGKKIDSD
jgi:predicted lipoprotein with Yx(FWY)xxD motif